MKDIPTIAAEMIGSVGVKHAAIARQEMKFNCRNKPYRIPRNESDCGKIKDSSKYMLTSNNKPTDGHGRNDHSRQAFCVFCHIGTREFNADGEEACCKYYAHYFERDGVRVGAPRSRVEYIADVWTYDDAKCGPKDDFVDVELCVYDQ
jgi:hypothetical protein